jgi:hypothetical protein
MENSIQTYVGNSYWSRRRRIRKNVAFHMRNVTEPVSTQSLSTVYVSNSSTGAVNCTLGNLQFPSDQSDTCEVGVGLPVQNSVANGTPDFSDLSEDDNIWHDPAGSSSDDEIFEDDSLGDKLKNWSILHGVTMSAMQDLLGILHSYHSCLPSDARTLRGTPRTIELKNFTQGGSYYHFGVKACIDKMYEAGLIDVSHSLSLQFNIDGLPIFKSSSFQLWPILMIVKEAKCDNPVAVGIYGGNKKPTSISEYLLQFVLEMKHLLLNGVTKGPCQVPVSIHTFVCDAPARSFLKNTKPYNGYSGCERCVQTGVWKGRIIYPDTNASLRTDCDFNEHRDEEHHTGVSPLQSLGIGMVSKFPLDYMHLVCLGVMRRLLLAWMRGSLSCRLPASSVLVISKKLVKLRSYIPSEFARKPRSLSEIDRWKATEFRQFLLYTGLVVLTGILPTHLLCHFNLLSVAIRLLVSRSLCAYYCNYAQQLLIAFVQQVEQLYGVEFLVYNVHSLIHIPDDAKLYGKLDNISAFPFENKLQQVKRLVKSARLPQQQVIRRIIEQQDYKSNKSRQMDFNLAQPHTDGPLPDGFVAAQQFALVHVLGYSLSLKKQDNCVLLKNRDVGLVRNILLQGSSVVLACQVFASKVNYFDEPLPSSDINIFKVDCLNNNLCCFPIEAVDCKCVILPLKGSISVTLPLQHQDLL